MFAMSFDVSLGLASSTFSMRAMTRALAGVLLAPAAHSLAPRYIPHYADACRPPKSLSPGLHILGLSPRTGNVVCQNVVPLYFAENTVTEASKPPDTPQWP
jgi:hypothetical protein